MNSIKLSQNEEAIASKFGMLDLIKKVKYELLSVRGISSVKFDLGLFNDNIFEIITIFKYDLPVTTHYYDDRKTMVKNAVKTCALNGLKRTEDPIENHGEHYYIVTKIDKELVGRMQSCRCCFT